MGKGEEKNPAEFIIGIGLSILSVGLILFISSFTIIGDSLGGFVAIATFIISIILILLGIGVTVKGLGRGVSQALGR